MEFVCEDIHFEPVKEGSASNAQTAQCPIRLTYRNGVRIEDAVFIVKYLDGARTFAIDGPRG